MNFILYSDFFFIFTEITNTQISFDSAMFNCVENSMSMCQVTGSLTGFSGNIEIDFMIHLSVDTTIDTATGDIVISVM